MALFNKRSSSDSANADGAAESTSSYTDPITRRARHRLIGASVLVVAAVLVLPWIFDVKPPTVSPNADIRIDGQNDTQPAANTHLALAPVQTGTPAPTESQTAAPSSAREQSPQAEPAANTRATANTPATPASAPKRSSEPPTVTRQPAPPRQPAQAPQPKPAPRKPENLDELIAQRQASNRTATQQAPQNKPATANTAPPTAQATPPVNYNFPEKGRFVVQIGAYVDASKVASVRKQLSQAGLNNYTQRVTINGQQVTRVRIGPFTSRKQMEQVANKVRALGLPVSLYQL